jgi:hypothetical protein
MSLAWRMEANMTNSSTRLLMGAVTGLGMATVSGSPIRGAAALEPASVTEPELLMNREQTWLSDTDGEVGDREQLRRYFLQDRRDGPHIRRPEVRR